MAESGLQGQTSPAVLGCPGWGYAELPRIPLPRTSVNKKRLGDFGPYRGEFGALLVAE
jgi:hypothetical protein